MKNKVKKWLIITKGTNWIDSLVIIGVINFLILVYTISIAGVFTLYVDSDKEPIGHKEMTKIPSG